MAGRLVICATPIGNLGDMTPRSLEELRKADVVCAEDTRVTGRLLAHFSIEKRLERLDEATMKHQVARIVERVAKGETIAFCSDAGMPGVSDPGARLIEAVRNAEYDVVVLPGASAVSTAYVASGFNNPHYYFGGFFPRRTNERRRVLEGLTSLDAVLVFFESPQRVDEALAAIESVFPHREVAVCRELTKLHEEVYRAPAPQVAAEFARRKAQEGVRGEIVLVIGPPTQKETADAEQKRSDSAARRAAELLGAGELSKKDVARVLRDEFGISRNGAYELVHETGFCRMPE